MDALNQPIIPLLGIQFSNMTKAAVIERLLARPEGARFAYVVTPNADHIERLMRLPMLRPIYRRALLCLLDSTLIALVAGKLGLSCPHVVNGADLTEALLPLLEGRRVAVIGMNDAAFSLLTRRYERISFIHYNPPMDLLHNTPGFFAARDFVCNAQAAFTFIAIGSPVQELLAYAVAAEPRACGVGLCIGSGLSFLAGTARRAPVWMRQSGLEWAHRLAHDPRRLAGRYLISDPRVLLALMATALREKFR